MVTEDYCDFETAKLLKEKGFDARCDKCYAYFADDDVRFITLKYPKLAQLLIENRYACVTLQMARKWLRKVHMIDIVITPSMFRGRYNVCIYKDEHLCCVDFDGVTLSPSYEQACEAAIKYCLENLI